MVIFLNQNTIFYYFYLIYFFIFICKIETYEDTTYCSFRIETYEDTIFYCDVKTLILYFLYLALYYFYENLNIVSVYLIYVFLDIIVLVYRSTCNDFVIF